MNPLWKTTVIMAGWLALSQGVTADQSIDTLQTLEQDDFATLTEDLGAALSYKPISPTEPLGWVGFDVGAEISTTAVSDSEVFARVSDDGDSSDYLTVARLHAHKGLPFGLDVGASLGSVVNSNATVFGVEGRYSVLEGTVISPALGVRAAYTRMSGVEAMDLATQSLDVSLSKGILMFTPYAGVGYVWTQGESNDNQALSKVTSAQPKIYGGVNLGLTLFNGVLEYDNTGGNSTYSLKLGIRF